MKPTFLNLAAFFLVFALAINTSYSQQDYRKLTGEFYKNNAKTIMCGCNTQGLLRYVASDGNSYNLTLCFDSEPGSFYEIFDGENITVEGNLKRVQCANDETYSVLYVSKSQLPAMQRKELVPEFIKRDSNQTKEPVLKLLQAGNNQKISGVYRKNTERTVMCDCSTQGLLSFVESNRGKNTVTLCFDSEPGSFYEIFDGENITVEGHVRSVHCANGKPYLVMYVEKSRLPMMQRQLVLPEALKKSQGVEQKIVTSPPPITNEEVMLEGSYMPSGSTKDNWSDYDDCNICGMINGNIRQPIIFERFKTNPDYGQNIRVWGTTKGRNFYVTRWEPID